MATDKVNEDLVEMKTRGRGLEDHWIDQHYRTPMRPSNGVTPVCESSIFCLLDDWEVINGCRK